MSADSTKDGAFPTVEGHSGYTWTTTRQSKDATEIATCRGWKQDTRTSDSLSAKMVG